MPFVNRFLASIHDIDAGHWNAVAGLDYPFLRHEFLAALEQSGSVSKERGWQPQHLVVAQDQQVVAVLPLYLKFHSYGEYVFDWRWAEAYQHHRLDYYPKLLAAIPFTPASGTRLAMQHPQPQQLLAHVEQSLKQHCTDIHASGWHLLFPSSDENRLWQAGASTQRLGCQFHWHNNHYHSFDDFLAAFSSRKRKNVNKERQRVAQQGVTLQRLTGAAIDDTAMALFYRFYQQTYARHSGHGGYLSADFFRRITESLADQMMLVLASQDNAVIAGALFFFSADTLYGRYWGALRDIDCLHFEACYYQGIEFCIERGLQHFDPGTQGEHKIARGFQPQLSYSRHWLADAGFNAAIDAFARQEAQSVLQYQQQAAALLPFRQLPPG